MNSVQSILDCLLKKTVNHSQKLASDVVQLFSSEIVSQNATLLTGDFTYLAYACEADQMISSVLGWNSRYQVL